MTSCDLRESGLARWLWREATQESDPSASRYPVKRNEKFLLDRPITDESLNTTYNNLYEFGSAKTISRAAQALPIQPWTIKMRRHGRAAAGHLHRRPARQDAA